MGSPDYNIIVSSEGSLANVVRVNPEFASKFDRFAGLNTSVEITDQDYDKLMLDIRMRGLNGQIWTPGFSSPRRPDDPTPLLNLRGLTLIKDPVGHSMHGLYILHLTNYGNPATPNIDFLNRATRIGLSKVLIHETFNLHPQLGEENIFGVRITYPGKPIFKPHHYLAGRVLLAVYGNQLLLRT